MVTSGQNASYWNAFLFFFNVPRIAVILMDFALTGSICECVKENHQHPSLLTIF